MKQVEDTYQVSQKELDGITDSLVLRFKKLINANGKNKIKNALLVQVRNIQTKEGIIFEIKGECNLTFSYDFNINWNAIIESLLK